MPLPTACEFEVLWSSALGSCVAPATAMGIGAMGAGSPLWETAPLTSAPRAPITGGTGKLSASHANDGAVCRQSLFGGEQYEFLDLRLCHQHPIKRIAMVPW